MPVVAPQPTKALAHPNAVDGANAENKVGKKKAGPPTSKEEAELTKKQRRLVRNRLSAQLHRERKKAHLEKLERDVKFLREENDKLKVQVKGLMVENKKLRQQVDSTKTMLLETEEMLSDDVGLDVDANLGILEDLAESEPGSPFFDDSSAADTIDSYVSRPEYAISPDNSDDELGLGDMSEMDMNINMGNTESEMLDLAEGLEGIDEIEDVDAFAVSLNDGAPEPSSAGPFGSLNRWVSSGVSVPMFVDSKKKAQV